jgi:cysteinyl-tRNA synthetase
MTNELYLYNTRTKTKELFVPRDTSNITAYLCGPTVYDLAHIGNARNAVIFDVLIRFLRIMYSKVTYVRNITDIDDKINNKAKELSVSIFDITSKTIIEYHKDMDSLFVRPPDIEPRATEHIQEIIDLVERIIANGHAYVLEGHVLFDVSTNKYAGILSGVHTSEPIKEPSSYKKNEADFVLWKPSTPDLPGWESPWGFGRPGWSIECSAMTHKHLGENFDIHGGGQDLIFPHHENEIAQSCCAFPGSNYANYWIHNHMVLIDGKKMSKSLGNFKTVRQLLDIAPGEALRFMLLKTHYRGDLNFTVDGLLEAKRDLDTFYRSLARYYNELNHDGIKFEKIKSFMNLIADDLNVPGAIVLMHAALQSNNQQSIQQLYDIGTLLGLFNHTPDEWFAGNADHTEIAAMIEERREAKLSKNWFRADEIRKELSLKGIILEDSPTGTTWRKI